VELLLPARRALADDDLLDLYDPGSTPSLRAGFVAAVDGAVAVDGSSRGLHTRSDSVAFRALRAVADAVLVGAGTVRKEDYGPVRLRPAGRAWRAAHGRTRDVPLVVVSRRLDLDPAGRWAVRPLVVTCESAPPERLAAVADVAEVLVHGDDEVDLPGAIAALHDRGLRALLCEGGPGLLQALLRDELVDELCLTVSPALAGGLPLLPVALPRPVPLHLTSLIDGGDGALLCRWALARG
jgi:riboflavin biosynthesis pyrimidine reductase